MIIVTKETGATFFFNEREHIRLALDKETRVFVAQSIRDKEFEVRGVESVTYTNEAQPVSQTFYTKRKWSEEDTGRNPDQKDETLTKLIEEIDRLDEERKQNIEYKSAKSGFAHTVRYFFLSNEINTLGELLSLGRKHVARCRNIGKMTMWAIDKALENLYGITEW